MGNRIGKNVGFFRGHALEIYFFDSSANSSCETAVEGPRTHGPSVPSFWDQSENGLQVEATLLGAWWVRNARSVASASKVAPTHARALAASHQTVAPPSAMGSKENPAVLAPAISVATGSGSAHNYFVAGPLEADTPAAPTGAAKSAVAAPAVDRADAVQSGMDGRF
jgi:hypothetical protein